MHRSHQPREDTFFQLRLQVAIMVQVQRGWRPLLPQARGAAAPLKDVEFECLGWLDWDWLFPDDAPGKQVPSRTYKQTIKPQENRFFLIRRFIKFLIR